LPAGTVGIVVDALTKIRRLALDEIVPATVEIAEIAAGYRVKLAVRMPDALVIATGRHSRQYRASRPTS
jgi:hypothetical protein